VAGLLVLGVSGVADIENLVRPRRVYAGVCRFQVVQIGVGRATLVDAVGVAPEMLPVPAARSAEVGYGFRATAVDENDAVWVVCISVQLGQCVCSVGILAAVLDDTMIVDDVVESVSEFVPRLVGGCGVVVLGRISLAEADKRNRTRA
jgi:hypothetical protein